MTEEPLDRLIRELIEEAKLNRAWLKILAWDNLHRLLIAALNEGWEFHLYKNLDGETSIRELADSVSKSVGAVSGRLNTWEQQGIVVQLASGKYDKIVDLEAVEVELPEKTHGAEQ